ncbi:DMT family transporter, partial [Amycolatopsis nivea]|uniref:DMT family transporter n=1 Tax=Amycolatopsis nivea TaxID=1644109 RepID=UPI00106FE203
PANSVSTTRGEPHYSTSAWILLVGSVAQGTYHFCSKPLLRRYTGLEVACYAMWAGTIFLAPLAPMAVHGLLSAPVSSTMSIVFLGLLPSALGFVLWGYGVARYSVTVATAALYLVPVVAVAVAFVWLGEIPGLVELLGGAISIAGVVLINFRRRRSSNPNPLQRELEGVS